MEFDYFYGPEDAEQYQFYERNPALFLPVWINPECRQGHDTHAGHAGGTGTVDPGLCAGNILYGAAVV